MSRRGNNEQMELEELKANIATTIKKSGHRLLKFSMITMGTFSFSFILMAWVANNNNPDNRFPAILAGIVFWVSLISAYVAFFNVNKMHKGILAGETNKPKPGICKFFQNPYAMAADIVMAVGLIAAIVTKIAVPQSVFFFWFFTALTVAGVQFHSVLNGSNFKYFFDIIDEPEPKPEPKPEPVVEPEPEPAVEPEEPIYNYTETNYGSTELPTAELPTAGPKEKEE